MLVLTRKPGESIDVYVEGKPEALMSIKVSEITNGAAGRKIRLAFDLPSNVIVLRSELDPPEPFVKPKREGEAA